MIGYRVVTWSREAGWGSPYYPWPGYWTRPRIGVVHMDRHPPDMDTSADCAPGVHCWCSVFIAIRTLQSNIHTIAEIWKVETLGETVVPDGDFLRHPKKMRSRGVRYLRRVFCGCRVHPGTHSLRVFCNRIEDEIE